MEMSIPYEIMLLQLKFKEEVAHLELGLSDDAAAADYAAYTLSLRDDSDFLKTEIERQKDALAPMVDKWKAVQTRFFDNNLD